MNDPFSTGAFAGLFPCIERAPASQLIPALIHNDISAAPKRVDLQRFGGKLGLFNPLRQHQSRVSLNPPNQQFSGKGWPVPVVAPLARTHAPATRRQSRMTGARAPIWPASDDRSPATTMPCWRAVRLRPGFGIWPTRFPVRSLAACPCRASRRSRNRRRRSPARVRRSWRGA